MQAGRRQFIAGLLAAGLVPKPTWADAGAPSFLSAAALPDGTHVVCGIDDALNITFQIPLPARGHAAAAHPHTPDAVAFARRPGRFAVVIDCTTGVHRATLNAPAGRHFYGHGAFSADGRLLFTTENDFEAGRGRIGVWDVAAGYTRIDEWDSGGIGPHDIKRLPNSDLLVVANGGIDTHPESGRTKLNIPTMRPNLAYIRGGAVAEMVELPQDMHKNSIRHLAVSDTGMVAFGMQWQGDGLPATLVGHHRLGGQMTLMQAAPGQIRDMQGYVGSIALLGAKDEIVVTFPRGGIVQIYDAPSAHIIRTLSIEDVCGVAAMGKRVVLTSGTGTLQALRGGALSISRTQTLRWDNHLVCVELA